MGALQVNYRIYADVRNENTGKIVAKQNDTKTRYLDITVTDNGVPIDLTGCEVRIYGKKYDNTEFYNDGSLQDAAAGRCLFEATTQMLAYPGQNVHCEIVVFKDNVQILSTMPFDIFVVKSLMGESAIESSNEYGALVVLFQNLYEAYDLMKTMVESFGESGETAASVPATTFWQMLEAVYRVNADALANASVQGVLDKIGATADTGGSSAAGTVMAKLNHLIGKTLDGIAGVTAQTKKFTQTVYGSVSIQKTTTINGSGRILVWAVREVNKMKVSVDGGMEFSIGLTDHVYEIYFDKSIKLSNTISDSDYYYYLHYIVQT